MAIQIFDRNECSTNIIQITSEQRGTKGHSHNYGA